MHTGKKGLEFLQLAAVGAHVKLKVCIQCMVTNYPGMQYLTVRLSAVVVMPRASMKTLGA